MPRARPHLRPVKLVVTCEHGGNRIPPRYRAHFERAARLLDSHRGYDPGALELARDFARALDAKLFYSTVSRLLVELNRSLGHPRGFSRLVPRSLRPELIERYYEPYRAEVASAISTAIESGRRVLHLSCHSFTPRLAGVRRSADIGLLYDPRRKAERRLCIEWKKRLEIEGALVVKLNYPYRGFADGFVRDLRRGFRQSDYLGIELEVSQKFPRAGGARWARLRRRLVSSFAEALRGFL